MKHKRYLLSLLTLILFSSLLMVVHAQTTTQPLPDAAGLLPEFNRWRNAIGIHSYQEDVRLSTSAQFHSEDMSDRAYFSHDAPSAVSCNDVPVQEQQERAACFGTWSSGEGIAGGYPDAASATRGWISSYGHCTGVMNSVATHMGGGYATGDDGNKWTFQFNGAQKLDPPVDHESFCSCTSGKDSEGDIQACVNNFNNNVTPVVPEIIPLERPLPRFPTETGESYGNTGNGSQAMCCFTFHPGVVTFRIVPVTGNPEGVMLELADSNFDVIPGVSGTDSFTYEVTNPSEFAIWYSSGNIAEGSTFYIEAEWNPPGFDPNNPPVEEAVESTDNTPSTGTGVCEQATNLTELKLYWNVTRTDNFTVATDRGFEDADNFNYMEIRTEGYVFSEQMPGTIPLKLYWNPDRTDNLTVATDRGFEDADDFNYMEIRTEGYICPDPSAIDLSSN